MKRAQPHALLSTVIQKSTRRLLIGSLVALRSAVHVSMYGIRRERRKRFASGNDMKSSKILAYNTVIQNRWSFNFLSIYLLRFASTPTIVLCYFLCCYYHLHLLQIKPTTCLIGKRLESVATTTSTRVTPHFSDREPWRWKGFRGGVLQVISMMTLR